jgi:pimeloyl-ACP methyl ester carboxylesterase
MTAPRPIFLHGAIGGSSCWGSIADRFDGAAVLGLPGHPEGRPLTSVPALTGWIALAIGQLPGARVLVGHGLGAQLALETTRAHPGLINGVIALGCAPRLAMPAVDIRDLDDAIDRLLGAAMRNPTSDHAELLADAMHADGAAALAADLTLLAEIDLGPRAAEVDCPVLVVSGDGDVIASPEAAGRLAAALPTSHAIIVTDAGHLVQADAPTTTQLLIAAFLARLELSLADT